MTLTGIEIQGKYVDITKVKYRKYIVNRLKTIFNNKGIPMEQGGLQVYQRFFVHDNNKENFYYNNIGGKHFYNDCIVFAKEWLEINLHYKLIKLYVDNKELQINIDNYEPMLMMMVDDLTKDDRIVIYELSNCTISIRWDWLYYTAFNGKIVQLIVDFSKITPT